jgi:hypothetical protein
MADPAPATGVASRRWWDLTPKELNIVAVTLLFLVTLPMLTKIFTSDFGTHIALGRHIVRDLKVNDPEIFNYTSLGMFNNNHEWGFQALLYLVYSAGGTYGVSLLVWAVVFGIFLLLYKATVLRGAHPLIAILANVAFSGFLRIRLQPRPEIFTYLFIAFTIWLFTEYLYGKRKKLVYLFPGLMLVWGNFHGSFLIGLVLGGAFFLDALLRAAWRRELAWEKLRTWVIPPVIAGLAGLVTSGLNPLGYDSLLAPLHLLSREGGQSATLISISELTPVKGTGFFVYYKAAALFTVVTLLLGMFGRKVYLLDLILFSVAFKGAWQSARAVSMMGLFLAPGAAIQFTGFLQRVWARFEPKPSPAKKDARRPKKGKPTEAAPPSRQAGTVTRIRPGFAAIALLIAATLFGFGVTTLGFSMSQLEYGVGMTEHKFSFEAAEFLRKNPIKGNMFNFFDIGGFLNWQLYPQALTFIDGRAINPQVFQDHQTVTGGMAGWERVIDKYGITYFVLKSMDSSGMILPIVSVLANDPNWALVFADGLFVVFVRKTTELRGYVKAHEISKGILPRHIIREAYHYTFLGISPVVAYQTMANMYLLMGDRSSAIQSLRSALEEVDDPYLRSRLMKLEQGHGAPGR